ncbi:MAG: hypothetical protein QM664_03145 [Flavihumibacter sp.]
MGYADGVRCIIAALNKPSATTDLTTQLSGAILLEAVAQMEKDKLF